MKADSATRVLFGLALAGAAVAGSANVADAEDISSYVGKYPFGDKVDGRTLYQIPELRRDFVTKLGEHQWVRLLGYQTAIPIETFTDPTLGKLIVTWQCRPHDCPNQAVVFLHPSGSVVGACFATVTVSTAVE
jgi:hypothetical protein